MYGEMFLTLLPMIPVSMVVLFFFVAINVIYRAVTIPPGVDKAHDGHCAACGYVLGSLSNQRCPECGVDLLKAGLITRRMFVQLRGSTVGAIAAWTVLFFSFAGTALAIWGSTIQTTQMMSSAMMGSSMGAYTQVASYGPATQWDEQAREIVGETFTVRIEVAVDMMSQQPTGGVLLVLEMPDSKEYTIEIDEYGDWTLKDAIGKKVDDGEELSAAVIDQLFTLGGFDPTDELFRSYAGQLFVLADEAIEDGVSGLQSGGSIKLNQIQAGNDQSMNLANYGWTINYTSSTVTTGFAALPSMPFSMWSTILYTFIVLIVVYLIGLFWIVRRRRRLLQLGLYTPSADAE